MKSVFLDIQGAFDSVSSHKLCKKLELAGIGPKMNNFLFNLLAEKTMLFDNGHFRDRRASFLGLPQGSCLSSILYNFYVNDIDACLEPNCTLRQFADDVVLSVACRDPAEARTSLQATINKLEAWSSEMGIMFSPEKIEKITCCFFSNTAGNKKAFLNQKLICSSRGKKLQKFDSVKYLGIWFDKKLKWSKHVAEQSRRCSRRINFLRTITGF